MVGECLNESATTLDKNDDGNEEHIWEDHSTTRVPFSLSRITFAWEFGCKTGACTRIYGIQSHVLFRKPIIALIVWKETWRRTTLRRRRRTRKMTTTTKSRKEERVHEKSVTPRHGDERKCHDENEDERERMDWRHDEERTPPIPTTTPTKRSIERGKETSVPTWNICASSKTAS